MTEKKRSRHSDGEKPPRFELDLGKKGRVVITVSVMSEEEERRFYTELQCIAGYLIRLKRGQGKEQDVQDRTQLE